MTRPTFGVDRDPGVVASLSPFGPRRQRVPLSSRPNPMVVVAGPGPAGAKCGGCAHLVVKNPNPTRRYFGCELRGPLNNGPSTDHLAGWPACRNYRPFTPQEDSK